MPTIATQFSGPFQNDRFGVITGTVTDSAFPNVAANVARLHARGTNTGPIYFGQQPTGTFWTLAAGDDTGWFSVPEFNLSHYRQRCPSGTANLLEYWVQY